MLLIATDNDREGENIGFEVIEVCREGELRQKNLSSTPKNIFIIGFFFLPKFFPPFLNAVNAGLQIKRLRFSAVTER